MGSSHSDDGLSSVSETLPKLGIAERLIIEMLIQHRELFGLQMVMLSEGRLKRGTAYVTLGRMVRKGYLRSRQDPLPPGGIGLPRRYYTATELGTRVFEAWETAERAFVAGNDNS
jgi:DNA-binding PadR family transcriptional regulator